MYVCMYVCMHCVYRSWIPLVTIDLSDEVKSLFIGSHIIPIEDIKEYHTYSQRFIQLCFSGTTYIHTNTYKHIHIYIHTYIGYVVGVFPWCLFAMLLREAYLDYASMRIVTPMVIHTYIHTLYMLLVCMVHSTY